MRGSFHIPSVLIGVEYQNCCHTLNVYLGFAIWIGQSQSKLPNGLWLMDWMVCKLQVCKLILIEFALSKYVATSK